LTALWHPKAEAWVRGRKNLLDTIALNFNEAPNSIIWFHCASLGEFEQGRPLMEEIKRKTPSQKIVLTFFSPSGYEIRKNYTGADYIYYLPLDTAKNARRLVQLFQPKLVIFVKYEFWYHHLKTLYKQKIPIYLIAGHFRENQVFFKWYGKWYKQLLHFFDHLFVQNEASKQLLQQYGITTVSIAGDPRIDRVFDIIEQVSTFPKIAHFKAQQPLLIAGSTHLNDIKILLPFIKQNKTWKIVLVPHEVNLNHIQQIQTLLANPALLYTSDSSPSELANARILVVNTIGMLSSLYQYAAIAYIGGGFDTGIHNILEPAIFKLPILIGPKFQKFEEAKALTKQGSTIIIHNSQDFLSSMELLVSVDQQQEYGQLNRAYLEKHKGGTAILYTFFKQLLEE